MHNEEGLFDPGQPLLLELCRDARMLVCISPSVDRLHGERIRQYFRTHFAPEQYRFLVLSTSESNKSIENVLRICEAAKAFWLDRHGLLVAIGGGIVLDMVGFAASIYRRGIRYIKVPTTLVGQVDVAVGVKTGVNLSGSKNLIGTYYPAYATLNDRGFLSTLPAREMRCGLAEIIKMGLVCDPEIFTALEAHFLPPVSRHLEHPLPQEAVLGAMVRMIEELQPNLFELNLERLVDFGHTFSMSLETVSGYAHAHGEAVAMDMALSACLSNELGILGEAEFERILALLEVVGLPVFDEALCSVDAMWQALMEVNVHRGHRINLVIPARIGEGMFLHRLEDVPRDALARAIRRMSVLSQRHAVAALGSAGEPLERASGA
ncbi:3-dehydroquinate synthase [Stigmatella aurantiaca DW4/3-1]|nr:3-dehydroquinate synthase [Stigmatella aurantiaca DW4/3-1]